MNARLVACAIFVVSSPLQSQRAERFMRDCEDSYYDRRREQFCEVREVSMRVPQRQLVVDGRENGGVSFYGWDRNEILVRALIRASGETRADAEGLAREIDIEVGRDSVRASGPTSGRRYRSDWSVSYEVMVPRRIDLAAITRNGGISVEQVEGKMDLEAENGGISLREAGGSINAHTTNGGVNARLSGTSWQGERLDLRTTNGGVVLDIPRGYNAELETGTVNGGMHVDFPITVQGRIGRRITTTLGRGGPLVRAVTTNGAVRIRER
ncbi:MAG TPA: DUF4097 family beta strand repeat-containing protein [Gemmatimonadaceae bacterium]|nr:DUF4097 family beta strand repeat-containing protein [Gemmatimonadaceae bacterium]